MGPARGLGRARGPGCGLGSGSGRGLVWGGCSARVPRMLAGAERTPTGAERAPDAGLGSGAGRRTLTGASMTQRPTGPRGPCSRSRGPTTWTSKASHDAGGGSPEHRGQWWGAQCPSRTAGGSALPPGIASVHPGSASIHPAGATEQRTCDHAARRRMVAPTRRSPPASGKRAYSIGALGSRGCRLR